MFYMTLPSNSSLNFFPNNVLTNYQTRLPHPIKLEGRWEVGLAEIVFPNTYDNVMEDRCWITVVTDLGVRTKHIPSGSYKSRITLLIALNHGMNTMAKDLKFEDKGFPRFELHPVSDQRLVLRVFGKKNIVKMSECLARMLGFDALEYGEGHHSAEEKINYIPRLDEIYLYCDIIEESIVGDSKVKLLRHIPIDLTDRSPVVKTFQHIYYRDIQKHEFHTIDLYLRDGSGYKVPFNSGRVIVVLHFRKKRSNHFI